VDWDSRIVVEILGLHLLESSVVAAGILIVLRFLNPRSASRRFNLARLALLKFIVPIGPLLGFLDLNTEGELSGLGASLNAWMESSVELIAPNSGFSFWSIWLSIWILGTFLLLIRYAASWRRSVIGTGRSQENPSLDRVRSMLCQLGYEDMGKSIRIEKETTFPVALVGFLRPEIVISDVFLSSLSDSELRSALRHEIEHLNRRDNFWRLVQVFVVCLFWYHPLVWYAHLRSCFESECACDEAAMSGTEGRGAYARCLLKAARFLSRSGRLWLPALTGNPLEKRIKAIVNFENKRDSKMKLLSMWALIALVMVTSGFMAADYQSISNAEIALKEKVYDLKDLDKNPRPLFQIRPKYPYDLKNEGIEGYAVIEWTISDSGFVLYPRAVQSTDRKFEQPAVEAIMQSRWQPGEIGGKAVKARVRQRINFNL